MSLDVLATLSPDLVEEIRQLVRDELREQLEAANASPSDLLSIVESAGYLGVSRRTIERALAAKKLEAKNVGRRVLIRRSDLDAFAEGERRGRSSANRSTPSLRL